MSRNDRLLSRVTTVLRRVYGRPGTPGDGNALEQLLLGVLQDGAPESKAAQALAHLRRVFVDWNEVRVGAIHEIAGALIAVPEAVLKARAIRAVLNRLADRSNELSLDYLKEKGPREGMRLIADIPGLPEAALARALVLGLGQDALPMTPKVTRACLRLGLVREGQDMEAMAQKVAGDLSPAARIELHRLLEKVASDVCVDPEPNCPACRLASDCPTGRKNLKARPMAGAPGADAPAIPTARRAISRKERKRKK